MSPGSYACISVTGAWCRWAVSRKTILAAEPFLEDCIYPSHFGHKILSQCNFLMKSSLVIKNQTGSILTTDFKLSRDKPTAVFFS